MSAGESTIRKKREIKNPLKSLNRMLTRSGKSLGTKSSVCGQAELRKSAASNQALAEPGVEGFLDRL